MGFLTRILAVSANILTMTIITPIWLVFSSIRAVLQLTVVKLHLGNSVEFLRGLDSGFVYKHLDRPGNRLNICSFTIIEGRPDPGKLRERVDERMLSCKSKKDANRSRAKRLTQYVRRSMGYFFWMDESDFRLENHVRFASTTSMCKRCNEEYPGTRCFKDERDLATFIADLSHEDFALDFSPWEILVLPKCQDDPEADAAYAIVFRFHHVIADGVSLVRSFLNCLVDEDIRTVDRRRSSEPKPADAEDVDPSPKISLPRSTIGIGDLIKGFFSMPRMAYNNFTKPDKNDLFGREFQGDRVMCWSDPLPLSLFRDVERVQKLPVTVNDVYVAGVTGALLKRTKYSTKQLVADKSANKLISNGDIRLPVPPTTDVKISAVIPVGLYACSCPPTVVQTPEQKSPPKTCNKCDPHWDNCLGNRVTVVRMELDCISDTPASRLRSTRERCSKMKKSADISASYFMGTYFFNVIPNPLFEPLIRNNTSTLVVSNLAGPDKCLHVFGNRCLRLAYWVPQTGDAGIGVSILSYNGQATLALAADKSLLTSYDDAKQFVDDIVTEIRLLAGATDVTKNKTGALKGKYPVDEFASLFPITPPAMGIHER